MTHSENLGSTPRGPKPSQTARGLNMALQKATITLEGVFLELLFMFYDYKVICDRFAH
jgi:hypothetical protein